MSPQCGQRVRGPGGTALPLASAQVALLRWPCSQSHDGSFGLCLEHAPAFSHIQSGLVSMSTMVLLPFAASR